MKPLRKRTLMIALTVTALAIFAFAGFASAQGGPDNGQGRGRGPGTPAAPTTPLTADEIQVLNEALQDEYHAAAVYDAVIADFGEVAPFVPIRQAEAQHAAVLERLFERYGLAAPANEWAEAEIASFESVEAACAAGVAAETANADLYNRALAATDKPDLTNVFTHLQAASLESHLPAFTACDIVPAQDGSGNQHGQSRGRQGGPNQGCGPNQGWGQGWNQNRPNQPNPDCTNPDGPQYDQNRSGQRQGGRRGRS